MRLAFRLLESAEARGEFSEIVVRSLDDRLNRFVDADLAQRDQLTQILVRDEKSDGDLPEETADADVHLERYRTRLGIVEGVEEI